MSGSQGIARDSICNVQLRAEQWEIVLQCLGKAPYEVSAPIIQSIVPQIMGTSNAEQTPASPPAPKSNGAAQPDAAAID